MLGGSPDCDAPKRSEAVRRKEKGSHNRRPSIAAEMYVWWVPDTATLACRTVPQRESGLSARECVSTMIDDIASV